jgi:hypothetical protein
MRNTLRILFMKLMVVTSFRFRLPAMAGLTPE